MKPTLIALAVLAFGASAAQAQEVVVKIGVAAPLTGTQAHLGKDIENGVRLAVEDAQAKGVVVAGKKVKFEIQAEDDQADPRTATTVAQRLADSNAKGVIGHLNSGASNNIMQATNMAKKMVTEFGFSEKLGPLRYTDNQEEVFLGHSVTQQKNMSDNTAMLIDAEVRRFVEDGERKARQILTEHKHELEAITRGLLEYETLSREDIDTLLRGEPLVRDGGYAKASDTPRRSSVPTSGPVGGDAEPQPGQ